MYPHTIWSVSQFLFGGAPSYSSHCCSLQHPHPHPPQASGVPWAFPWTCRPHCPHNGSPPSLLTFLMALDSGVTMTPKCGHHMTRHNPSCSLPISPVPLVWPEGLGGKPVLVPCPSLSSPWFQAIGLGPLRHPYGVTQRFRNRVGRSHNCRGREQALPGRGLQSLKCSQWGREPIWFWRVSHMPHTVKVKRESDWSILFLTRIRTL